MRVTTITNPKTGRQIKVKAWRVEPREVLAKFEAGEYKDARDLSWALLSDRQTERAMAASEYGDSQANNFALNVLENALDWGLGLKAITFIRQTVKGYKKMPKPFEVAAARNGDVFIVTQSGAVYA